MESGSFQPLETCAVGAAGRRIRRRREFVSHEKHKRARKEGRCYVAAIRDRGVEGEGFLDRE